MGSKTVSRGVGKHRVANRAGRTAPEKPVALTLKVDSELYVRLSTLRAKERKTSQEILEQALKEFLNRAGA